MAAIQRWWGEQQQRWMTRLANRTFRKNPGSVDRLALRVLTRMAGELPDDPELEHPD